LAGPSSVWAQEESPETETNRVVPVPSGNINLSVSPISVVLETSPGEMVRSTVKIRNNGIEPEYLVADLAKFEASGVEGEPVIREFEDSEVWQNWIRFDEQEFVVEPGEWKSVNFTFEPSSEAGLNYFYTIMFRRQREVDPGTTTSLTGAPAVLVLANVVSPQSRAELQLEEFSVPKMVFEFLPVRFKVKVKNSGNVFLAPTGNVFIDGGGKKDIAILSFNKGGGYVLPDTSREYAAIWEEGFPVYKVKTEDGAEVKNEAGESVYELEWDFSQIDKMRWGRYKANLLLVYDNGERDVPIESQVAFWVIPWRILAAIVAIGLLVLAGIGSLLRPILRRVWRRNRKK